MTSYSLYISAYVIIIAQKNYLQVNKPYISTMWNAVGIKEVIKPKFNDVSGMFDMRFPLNEEIQKK